MTRQQRVGKWGEEYAEKYVTNLGRLVLARNVHTPYGELDIIAQDQDIIIFYEVKTRTSRSFGYPETAVNARKLTHIADSAQYYLQQNPQLGLHWRIDVISILKMPGSSKIEVEIFENVST